MKALMVSVFFLTLNATAQVVSVECPLSYPPKESAIEIVPSGHKGRGLIHAKNVLEDWSLFDGEFAESAQVHTGKKTQVPGGTDTVVPPIRWFVCHYRGGISWWEESGADRAAEKGLLKQGCIVQTRTRTKSFKLICN